MFRTLSGTADPLDYSKPKDYEEKNKSNHSKSGDSIATEQDEDQIEQAGQQVSEEYEEHIEDERSSPQRSAQLKRTNSNVLSRVSSHLTTHSLPDPGPPPDGGLNAWTQIAMVAYSIMYSSPVVEAPLASLGWLAIVTTWGFVNCFGVFQTYYTLEGPQRLNLGVSPSAISWIGTIQNFFTFVIGAVSGRLLDAGYFLPTVIVGVFFQLLGIFMLSLSTQYWQIFLTQGVLCGIGGGLFFTPCMGVMATWFSKRRSFAMGCASTGNSVGGMLYPVIVRELLPKVGFAWTVRTLGFLNLGLLALVIAFMKPRLPPRKSDALVDWSAFRELPFAMFTLGLFFMVWDIYFTLYYVSSFGVDALGLPFDKAAILLIIINGIGVPARLVPGYAADYLGQLNLMMPISWSLAVIAWSWLAVRDVAGLYVFVCFFGLTAAALQCLLPPTVAALTSDLRVIGTRLGMVFACMGFAGLTGPPIGGAIQGAQGGKYTGAQAWAASTTLICAVCFTIARMSRAQWKLRAKV